MSRVLVLNATFEPLAVVSARRAVCLVLDRKVEMVHSTDRAFRSEKRSVAVPSVVRLSRYVNVPRAPRRSPNRRAIFARDRDSCQYCGARAETMDHVLPRSRGGQHTWENVVAACRRCNASKRDRLPSESGMRLSRRPAPPSAVTWVELAAGGLPDVWADYLLPQGDLRSA
ncbi:MAG: HNH endonuclease [Acidimicrobiaceae bacterium]|nr:HNH endonuclease [Acidimicrobiaceae bacterium]MCY4175767.1 HNH endonuclease [Acidimicrobiaceae bacterium]MCY4280860.1 HNH endonuclease [Acidimicrobiaceae bacterium]MCY4294585.1 HNH endonuclease [Acidimicrobiaceae bacterium]